MNKKLIINSYIVRLGKKLPDTVENKVLLAGLTVKSSHLGFLQWRLTTKECLRARHDPTGLSEIHNALVCYILWPVYYYHSY